jgi:hypothetical protein
MTRESKQSGLSFVIVLVVVLLSIAIVRSEAAGWDTPRVLDRDTNDWITKQETTGKAKALRKDPSGAEIWEIKQDDAHGARGFCVFLVSSPPDAVHRWLPALTAGDEGKSILDSGISQPPSHGNEKTARGAPIEVEVPGLGTIEFPEGMSKDDIRAALKRVLPPSVAPPSALARKPIDSSQGQGGLEELAAEWDRQHSGGTIGPASPLTPQQTAIIAVSVASIVALGLIFFVVRRLVGWRNLGQKLRARKRAFGLSALGVAVLWTLLNPPWKAYRGIRWNFLFEPPGDGTISFGILFVELALIAVVSAFVYLLFRTKSGNRL